MNRKIVVSKNYFLSALLLLLVLSSCKENKAKNEEQTESEEMVQEEAEPFFKLSLAQWSLNQAIRNDSLDPYTFAEKAKNWGFSGLEYVSALYYKELQAADFSKEAMANFVSKSNAEAEKHGMKNLLIMVDVQGDLAAPDAAVRKKAVENHFKWVDAAAAMGCHGIRVNLAGSTEPEEWMASSVDGLTQLATYAKTKDINIMVENHGGLSSNAAMLAEVMTKVGMDNCGTLPDFGNFCITPKDPKDWRAGCAETYDMYKGVTELMPHALAVSAKANEFDANGNEVKIDYVKMLQIVKDAGYTGYIGVEYEGSVLGEEEGIIATRDLMLKAAKEIK